MHSTKLEKFTKHVVLYKMKGGLNFNTFEVSYPRNNIDLS